MELKKLIDLKVYEVIANYKVKEENAPFVSIFQAAKEHGGGINAQELHESLLSPISRKACDNLLKRLSEMGYFDRGDEEERLYNNESIYELTDLGYKSAAENVFYDSREGLLKIYCIENETLIPRQIVRIEESSQTKAMKGGNTAKTPGILTQKINEIIHLKNGSFIFDNFQKNCHIAESKEADLKLDANDNKTIISCVDYENYLPESREELKREILKNEFQYSYDEYKDVLLSEFNPADLSFRRMVNIDYPEALHTDFDPISLNIDMVPKNNTVAKTWYKELLKQNIKQHILSENGFLELAKKQADEMPEHPNYEKPKITFNAFKSALAPKEDFYTLAKLETFNYLKY